MTEYTIALITDCPKRWAYGRRATTSRATYRPTSSTGSGRRWGFRSVNRSKPEFGVPIGGPSLVVGPDGQVILETDFISLMRSCSSRRCYLLLL